jgi:nicotinamide phosphoribosyltransferase
MNNLLAFGTDSYKHSHHSFYAPGTERIHSYFESRPGSFFPSSLFFGLQYYLKKHFVGQFVTQERIDEAAEIASKHFGRDDVFNRVGWQYILDEHGGRLPLQVNAVPEGTLVPESNVMYTLENTDNRVPWIVSHVETMLLHVWAPLTVATSSRAILSVIKEYLERTGTPDNLPFMLHDFGMRGVSCHEEAAIAGAAHLVSSMGTDTMAAIGLLRDYYGADMPGFSIPATEHSVMTQRGVEGEVEVVKQVLAAYPNGLVAMVGDSYDMINFAENILGHPDIKPLIQQREGRVVCRPDSGTLPDIDVDVFEALARVFGVSKNIKGYDVLPPYIGMIQGDGIEWTETEFGDRDHTAWEILKEFERRKISADNICFGSGGGLLRKWNRDTQKIALKESWTQINGVGRDVWKNAPGKASKRGRLGLYEIDGQLRTMQEGYSPDNLLVPVYRNGQMLVDQTFDEIRERAAL